MFLSVESLPADPGCRLCGEGDGRWLSGQAARPPHPKSQQGATGLLQPPIAKTLLQGRGRGEHSHPSPDHKVSAHTARGG